MTQTLKPHIPQAKRMFDMFLSASGIGLQIHHYQQLSLPTWTPPSDAAVNNANATATNYAHQIGNSH